MRVTYGEVRETSIYIHLYTVRRDENTLAGRKLIFQRDDETRLSFTVCIADKWRRVPSPWRLKISRLGRYTQGGVEIHLNANDSRFFPEI